MRDKTDHRNRGSCVGGKRNANFTRNSNKTRQHQRVKYKNLQPIDDSGSVSESLVFMPSDSGSNLNLSATASDGRADDEHEIISPSVDQSAWKLHCLFLVCCCLLPLLLVLCLLMAASAHAFQRFSDPVAIP